MITENDFKKMTLSEFSGAVSMLVSSKPDDRFEIQLPQELANQTKFKNHRTSLFENAAAKGYHLSEIKKENSDYLFTFNRGSQSSVTFIEDGVEEELNNFETSVLIDIGVSPYRVRSRGKNIIEGKTDPLLEIAEVINGGVTLADGSLIECITGTTLVGKAVLHKGERLEKAKHKAGKPININDAIAISAFAYDAKDVATPTIIEGFSDTENVYVSSSVHIIKLKKEYKKCRFNLFKFFLSEQFKQQFNIGDGKRYKLPVKELRAVQVPEWVIKDSDDKIQAETLQLIEKTLSVAQLNREITEAVERLKVHDDRSTKTPA